MGATSWLWVYSLAMHFDTQVLLNLKKVPPDSKPQASFDCARATTPIEKTICGSLAARAGRVGTNVTCIEDHLARRVGELVEEDNVTGRT
jgi:hypothetical protein